MKTTVRHKADEWIAAVNSGQVRVGRPSRVKPTSKPASTETSMPRHKNLPPQTKYSVTYQPGWGHEGETIYRGTLNASGKPIATYQESGTGGATIIRPTDQDAYAEFERFVEELDLSYTSETGREMSVTFERPQWVITLLLERAIEGGSKKPSAKIPSQRRADTADRLFTLLMKVAEMGGAARFMQAVGMGNEKGKPAISKVRPTDDGYVVTFTLTGRDTSPVVKRRVLAKMKANKRGIFVPAGMSFNQPAWDWTLTDDQAKKLIEGLGGTSKAPSEKKPSPKKLSSRRPSPKQPTPRKPSPKQPTPRKPSPKADESLKIMLRGVARSHPSLEIIGGISITDPAFQDVTGPAITLDYGKDQLATIETRPGRPPYLIRYSNSRGRFVYPASTLGEVETWVTLEISDRERIRPAPVKPLSPKRPSPRKPSPKKPSPRRASGLPADPAEQIAMIRKVIKARVPGVAVKRGSGTASGWIGIWSVGEVFTPEHRAALTGLGLAPGGNYANISPDDRRAVLGAWLADPVLAAIALGKKPSARKPSPKKPSPRKLSSPALDVQGSGAYTAYWETDNPKTIHRYSYASKEAATEAAEDRAKALGIYVTVLKNGVEIATVHGRKPSPRKPSAKKPSVRKAPSKKPSAKKAAEVKLKITYRTAFRKLAAIEGSKWARRQRDGGVKLDNGFFLNKRAYETIVEQGLGGADIPLAELDAAAGVIAGESEAAYIVMPDGEIMLDGASTTQAKRDEAAKVMQVI
jgi:hypothetical protein